MRTQPGRPGPGQPGPAGAGGPAGTGSRVRLRLMHRGDMPAIMALERELFPDDAWTPQMFKREIAQPASRRLYLVAEDDNGPAGYAGIMFTGGAQADVLTLAVARSRWAQGIGTALLAALLSEAGRRGCAEVLLEVREDNPRARRLYLRHGFTEVGIRRGYYQPSGVDAVVMRKELR